MSKEKLERAAQFIDEFISPIQKEAAKELGITPAAISHVHCLRQGVSKKLLWKLVIDYRMNANWYFTGRGRKRLKPLNRITKH
jgi:transcriptional regulator with XRE-family HTH domain